jgi:hypothetical protein
MEEPPHTGGCLCGAVRYELSGTVSNLCYCHCNSCRRATGAPMVAWGTVARGNLRITRGTLAAHRSSPPVLRGLCAACGTCISYGHDARAAEIDVTLASLDEPARLAPRMHVWVADKLPWVRIADDLPQFAGSPGSAGPP